jgi:hypothetical protein
VTAGGVSCSGPLAHRQRQWCEVDGRRIAVRDGGDVVLLPPVPGAPAGILTFDAFRRAVVLDDGSAFRFDDGRSAVASAPAAWRASAPAVTKEEVAMSKNTPALIAGGSTCGGLWVATAERKLFLWNPGGRVPVTELPVPGTARILAYDASRKVVLLEDGSRLLFRGGRWHAIGGLTDTAGLKVRARSGTVLADHSLFEEGSVRVLPEREAMDLIGKGQAEFAEAE